MTTMTKTMETDDLQKYHDRHPGKIFLAVVLGVAGVRIVDQLVEEVQIVDPLVPEVRIVEALHQTPSNRNIAGKKSRKLVRQG